MKTLISTVVFLVACTGVFLLHTYGRAYWHPLYIKVAGARTIADVNAQYGKEARQRMEPYFKQAAMAYPPKSVSLLTIKDEAVLELWDTSNQEPVFIREYPIQALSGVSGPKLREGDRQVPEGIYQVEYLNPNSSYHLSIKLNYPNAFDLRHAQAEGRSEPGTNIFIHGKAVSIGCLAMGDKVAEELFILTTDVGPSHVEVAIAPSDPRRHSLEPMTELPWTKELYQKLSDHYMLFSAK